MPPRPWVPASWRSSLEALASTELVLGPGCACKKRVVPPDVVVIAHEGGQAGQDQFQSFDVCSYDQVGTFDSHTKHSEWVFATDECMEAVAAEYCRRKAEQGRLMDVASCQSRIQRPSSCPSVAGRRRPNLAHFEVPSSVGLVKLDSRTLREDHLQRTAVRRSRRKPKLKGPEEIRRSAELVKADETLWREVDSEPASFGVSSNSEAAGTSSQSDAESRMPRSSLEGSNAGTPSAPPSSPDEDSLGPDADLAVTSKLPQASICKLQVQSANCQTADRASDFLSPPTIELSTSDVYCIPTPSTIEYSSQAQGSRTDSSSISEGRCFLELRDDATSNSDRRGIDAVEISKEASIVNDASQKARPEANVTCFPPPLPEVELDCRSQERMMRQRRLDFEEAEKTAMEDLMDLELEVIMSEQRMKVVGARHGERHAIC